MKSKTQLALEISAPTIDGLRSAWRAGASAQIQAQLPADWRPFAGPVRLVLKAGLSPDAQPLAQVAAEIAVLLVSERLVLDASLFADIEARGDRAIAAGQVKVELAPAVPPAKRNSAKGREAISQAQRERWAAYRAGKEAAA